MPRTRVKFCGMTLASDAALAADLGVDAIGMVLHANARRRIDIDNARQIARQLPPFVTRVALFVDAATTLIEETARRLRSRTIQLHGDESVDAVAALHDFDVIKAVRTDPHTVRGTLDTWRSYARESRGSNLVGLLMDGPAGGSGVANDFELIRTLQREGAFDGLPPIILAGGLNAENVGPLICELRPFAVDVSSGIEIEHGRKSREKMTAFLAAVADADARRGNG